MSLESLPFDTQKTPDDMPHTLSCISLSGNLSFRPEMALESPLGWPAGRPGIVLCRRRCDGTREGFVLP